MRKNPLKIYQSNQTKLPGSSHAELLKNAWKIYNEIAASTRRRPYIRSDRKSYFHGQKIFINVYLPHINQKNRADADRRLRLMPATFDLIKHNTYPPIFAKEDQSGNTLLRFSGSQRDGTIFCVQIQVNKHGERYLMSSFPAQ